MYAVTCLIHGTKKIAKKIAKFAILAQEIDIIKYRFLKIEEAKSTEKIPATKQTDTPALIIEYSMLSPTFSCSNDLT